MMNIKILDDLYKDLELCSLLLWDKLFDKDIVDKLTSFHLRVTGAFDNCLRSHGVGNLLLNESLKGRNWYKFDDVQFV